MPGVLYVVSTPIGNLEDITLRALRVLKTVSLIAAEDTRHTATLLRHYDIRTPTTSFHEHNEREKTAGLLARLARGDTVAVVSDAGTPGIADPGYRLVRAALDAGCRVEAIPGPSAILAALVSSGFPTDSFTFLGFPPRKAGQRHKWLAQLASEPRTVVFFEAPHKLLRTLNELGRELGDRPIVVARELTKAHEELVYRPILEIASRLKTVKGEMTIVVPPAKTSDNPVELPGNEQVAAFIGQMTNVEGLSRRGAIVRAARHFGVPARTIFAALERMKKERDSCLP